MKTLFTELFAYNRHCNQQLAAAMAAPGVKPDERSLALFSHVLNAHQIWNQRILGQSITCGVWDIRPAASFAEADRRNYEETAGILTSDDLERIVSYRNTRGDAFSNRLADILFHIVNHSTYHRGQIATLFRQHGMNPTPTDYILYKR